MESKDTELVATYVTYRHHEQHQENSVDTLPGITPSDIPYKDVHVVLLFRYSSYAPVS